MSGFDQTEEEVMLVWNRSAEGSRPRRGSKADATGLAPK